ncbi:MAG TPA: hypothetical protein VGS19_37130 [Streptosporangiaceae bacterium]|nr:hypothetical protein [Streptosporangiaceae bacterium]
MYTWSRHRAATRAGAGLIACALTAFLTVTAAGSAMASAPVWRLQRSPNATLPGGQLESVSCSSATACTAVGSALDTVGINVTVAERWNGSTWQRQPTPNPAVDTSPDVRPSLTGVSCPASGFCAAVGTYNVGNTTVGLAEGWNGHRWTMQRFPVPLGATSTALSQVSCTSARFCEAVGSYQINILNETLPLVATWTGTSWRLQHAPHPSGDPSLQLNAVSCASMAFCEAWGGPSPSSGGSQDLAEQWDGHSWHVQPVPANSDAFSVSCVSTAFCEAVGLDFGNAGSAWVWHGSSWTAQTVPSQVSSGGPIGVSCLSPRFCEAVGVSLSGPGSLAAAWNGSAWKVQPTPNPAKTASTNIRSVACASARSCESAGSFQLSVTSNPARALAEGWDGSTWALQQAVAPPGVTANVLSAVSCVSATFCEAVGEHGNSLNTQSNLAEVWNGTTWRVQPTPSPQSPFGAVDNDLEGVSCVSATFCEAVGNGPNGMSALAWDGTSWKVQNRPGAGGVQGQFVSCPSAGFCMSIDAFGRVDTWNGSSWSAGTDLTGFSLVGGVSCVSASFCEVVGSGPSGESAAMWNGSTWTDQPTPGGAGEDLTAVTCLTATSCEAVGALFSQGNPLALAEAWNGSTWTLQSTPSPSPSQGSTLKSVSCTAADACTAVGDSQASSFGPFRTLAEVWNGTAWSLRSTPNHVNAGQNILNGVSCGASQVCTAVGQTLDAVQIQATLIESGD